MANIKLKNRRGEDTIYEGIESVTLPDEDGEPVTFYPPVNLQEKSVTVTENGDTVVEPDTGYSGLSAVNLTVDVAGGGGEKPEYLISVGDLLSTAYINTAYPESTMNTWLEGLTYDKTDTIAAGVDVPYRELLIGDLSGVDTPIIYAAEIPPALFGSTIYIVYDIAGNIIYSSEAFDASAIVSGLVVENAGWQMAVYESGVSAEITAIDEEFTVIDYCFAKQKIDFGLVLLALNADENGMYVPQNADGYSSVNVDVQGGSNTVPYYIIRSGHTTGTGGREVKKLTISGLPLNPEIVDAIIGYTYSYSVSGSVSSNPRISTWERISNDKLEIVNGTNNATASYTFVGTYDYDTKNGYTMFLKVKMPNATATVNADGTFDVSLNSDGPYSFSASLPSTGTEAEPYIIPMPIKNLTVADGVTSIRQNQFSYNGTMSTVSFPNNTITISSSAFSTCGSIENIIFKNTVTLQSSAFRYCKSLESVKFLGDVASIGNYCFGSCTALEELDFSNCTYVPTLSNTNAIPNNDLLVIKVPTSLYDTWIAASKWSSFASKIVAV